MSMMHGQTISNIKSSIDKYEYPRSASCYRNVVSKIMIETGSSVWGLSIAVEGYAGTLLLVLNKLE